MTTIEHLLVVLNEEALEVAGIADKTLRFGISSRQPSTGKTNMELLVEEINHFFAMVEMLQSTKVLPADILNKAVIQQKKDKVVEYIRYARQEGTIRDE